MHWRVRKLVGNESADGSDPYDSCRSFSDSMIARYQDGAQNVSNNCSKSNDPTRFALRRREQRIDEVLEDVDVYRRAVEWRTARRLSLGFEISV